MAKRRGHGEGGIYQRESDGKWCASVDLGFVNGKRRRKVIYGKTRKEVADKLKTLHRDQASGVHLAVERQTVETFLLRWLDDVVSQRNKARTQDSYRNTVRRHIVPTLGHYQLDQLRPEHVQMLIGALQAQELHRTAQYARTILVRALNQAVKWRLLSYNPAALTESPHVEKHVIEPLTIQQESGSIVKPLFANSLVPTPSATLHELPTPRLPVRSAQGNRSLLYHWGVDSSRRVLIIGD